MMRRLSLWMFIVCAALVLVGWNGSRFFGAKAKIRAKNLDFLPSPVAAKMMSLGQSNTVAKLRWIDSFAYFQYQLDVKDDRVSGADERGGFYRLYDTLAYLDPHFVPFYEHAAMNLSGVLSNHHQALSFLMRGLQALPHETVLWRNTAAHLKMFYHYEQDHTQAFDEFLAAWEAAEDTDDGKLMVLRWKQEMAKRTYKGLEQMPYWFDQLARTNAQSAVGKYVEESIRVRLAHYGINELTALMTQYRRLMQPTVVSSAYDLTHARDIALPDMLRLGPVPTSLSVLVQPRLLAARYGQQYPALAPFEMDKNGRVRLRADPFGYPWQLKEGRVYSAGLERLRYSQLLTSFTGVMTTMAKDKGTWPQTIAEARQWGLHVPDPPVDGTLSITDHQFQIDWATPPNEPWPLRANK